MPRLTNARIKSIRKPGRYGDERTLHLFVMKGTLAKYWVQRLTVNGTRREIGLGPWPLVSLAEARDAAFENRRTVRRGGDPLADRRKPTAPTFEQSAIATIDAKRPGWRAPKTARKWERTLELYAYPVLGKMRVDRIQQADVLKAVSPVWVEKPETGRMLRQYIRSVFSWAMAQGHRADNPAGEGIDAALPKQGNGKQHHKALPYSEVAAAIKAVDGGKSSLAAKLCLRFIVATACRSGEARGALWSEIDLAAKAWRIPRERMKNGKPHVVMLNDLALSALRDAEPLRDRTGRVFPSASRPGTELSDNTLSRQLRDAKLPGTVHGMRSAFRTWAAEQTNFPREVAEHALSHTVGSEVERSYQHSTLEAKRVHLMAAWSEYLTGESAKVMPLRKGAAA